MPAMINLDHAASTPVRPAARAALLRVLDADPGNASSSHGLGRIAREAVEAARDEVAAGLGAAPADVVFTSGGTESDNLAVKGLAWAAAAQGRRHLVVSAVEHPAVREAAAWLAARGDVELSVAPVDAHGRLDLDAFADLLRDDTGVVSVMLANNELGTVQDVRAVADLAHARGAVVHTDAVQAVASQPVDLAALGVDALSVSGHKFGAPQGVGALVTRRGVPIESLAHGGNQDRAVRSGTFAAGLVASLGAGLAAAGADRERLAVAARRQTDHLADVLTAVDGVRRTTASDTPTLPTHLHLLVDGVAGDELLFALDRAGVAASGGAACGSGALTASPVMTACGIEADAALRLSVGWTTTDDEVARAGAVLVEVIAALRAGRPVVSA